VLPNLSLVTEFLGNVFTNFIFEEFFSHEAVVTGRVTATSNNQTQLFKELQIKKIFERYKRTPSEAYSLPKLISCLQSFLLNEYDWQILSSVFLIEMFDLWGNELKYVK